MIFVPIERTDLEHVAGGYPSCIHEQQMLRVDGDVPMTAGDIADAVQRGQRVDFVTPTLLGYGQCYNPVVGVVRTRAAGVRITFADGRSVSLTTGHVLPLGSPQVDPDLDPRSGRDWADSIPITQQWIVHAGSVRPGMELLDGRVEQVKSIGRIPAVRIWTHHPAWVSTVDGLSIGTRWHEVIHAWAAVSQDDYGDIVPHAATGWPWGTGHLSAYGGYQLHSAVSADRVPVGNDDGRISVAQLGMADSVRQTLGKRSQYLWNGDGHMPPRVRRKCRTDGFKSLDIDDVMIGGIEVIGEPVVVDHEAVTA